MTINPYQLADLLQRNGFTFAGHCTNAYTRLNWPGDRRASMTIPLNPEYADYDEGIRCALIELERAAEVGKHARAVLDELDEEEWGNTPPEPSDDIRQILLTMPHPIAPVLAYRGEWKGEWVTARYGTRRWGGLCRHLPEASWVPLIPDMGIPPQPLTVRTDEGLTP